MKDKNEPIENFGQFVASLAKFGIRGLDLAGIVTENAPRAQVAREIAGWLQKRPKG